MVEEVFVIVDKVDGNYLLWRNNYGWVDTFSAATLWVDEYECCAYCEKKNIYKEGNFVHVLKAEVKLVESIDEDGVLHTELDRLREQIDKIIEQAKELNISPRDIVLLEDE